MRLIFDENLSPKMVMALADVFPDSAHVDRIGLGGDSDDVVWQQLKLLHSCAQHGLKLVI